MYLSSILNFIVALVLAPLLPGIINKTKAAFAGRQGQPVLQLYFDLAKLLRKGAVYSHTTTWIFRAGPIVGLACIVSATALTPLGGVSGIITFPGDLILLAYLLALMRFITVLAALDTGSSFEGMGASREVQFSALAEPALLLGLGALARMTSNLSLVGIFTFPASTPWGHYAPALVLIGAAFLIVFLTENARIPVDDPNTHLELTMIHEVMVLDHSGPGFAFIQYGAALKLWVLGACIINLALPCRAGIPAIDLPAAWLAMAALAIIVGVIESSMARLRLLRVPRLLISATVLAGFALILILK